MKADPITKDGLIDELGFVEHEPNDFYFGRKGMNIYGDSFSQVDVLINGEWINVPNCTTIQDIKDLIRLFNIEK